MLWWDLDYVLKMSLISMISDHGVRFKDDFLGGWTNEKYAHMHMERFSLNSPQPSSKVGNKERKKEK